MLSGRFVSLLKDMLLVSAVFLALSGAYYGLAVTERYRALTRAYIAQSEQLISLIQQNRGVPNVQSEAKPD